MDAKRSCRMGELEPWIDENFIRTVWFGMGYQVNVKMIRDKFSGCVRSAHTHDIGDSNQLTEATPATASLISRTQRPPPRHSS